MTPPKQTVEEQMAHQVIRIQPTKGFSSLGLGELWEYRDLLWFNILKNIKSKYRQMALGPLWIILQPVINMVLFTFVFGTMAGLSDEGIPYPLLTFSALISWNFFQNSCTFASNSLVTQMPVISKVYFPRMIIPLADALAWLVDFAITFAILLIMMACYGIYPGLKILFIPLYVLLTLVTTMAVGMWTASLTVKFRDVRFVVQYGLRVFMFLTPVAYAASHLENALPEGWAWLLKMNPLYWVIEGFRWALLDGPNGPEFFMIYPIMLVLFLLVTGAYMFRRTERTIVDLL
ncbi:ABC transporter permease [Akkermansiaceae bacterium]|nr:ABC transporter permease [Akkermansiaceae bacterium]